MFRFIKKEYLVHKWPTIAEKDEKGELSIISSSEAETYEFRKKTYFLIQENGEFHEIKVF
jgi:lipopolysaccharide export LptBFGC system permease protein LptF